VTVKKATLPAASLPPVDGQNRYSYRYRIVSEDKNRTSAWSPIKTIDAPAVILLNLNQGDVAVSSSSITVTWSDQNNRPRYDVFVKFNTDADYVYHGTASTNTYSFVKKTGATTVSVAIQVEGITVPIISEEGVEVGRTKIFYGTTGNILLVYAYPNKTL
jgi:hypothetical protein